MPVLKQNANRFRKVYPGIRKSAKYNTSKKIEGGIITMTDTSSGTYTFVDTYTSIPAVTASVYDSAGSGVGNINVYISSITTTEVILETSATITGKIHVQVIEV